MKKAVRTEILNCSIRKVWDVITDNKKFSWRSDLKEIRIVDDSKFIEIDKKGFETEFDITRKDAYKFYEFDMKNDHMTGHWTGVLEEIDHGTKIVFTEEVEMGNAILDWIAGFYLKQQQKRYMADLKRELGLK